MEQLGFGFEGVQYKPNNIPYQKIGATAEREMGLNGKWVPKNPKPYAPAYRPAAINGEQLSFSFAKDSFLKGNFLKGSLAMAGIGAVLGGLYGHFSDNGSVLGGAAKGALLGGLAPIAMYGAGKGMSKLGGVLSKNAQGSIVKNLAGNMFSNYGKALKGAGLLAGRGNWIKSPGSIKGLGMIGAGHVLGGAALGAAGWGLAGLMRDGYEFDGVRQAGFWGAVGSGALIGGAAFGTKMGFRMAGPPVKSLVQGFNKMVGSARPVTQKNVFSTASSGLMKAVGKGAAVVGVNGAFMAAATAQGFRYTRPVNSAPPKRV